MRLQLVCGLVIAAALQACGQAAAPSYQPASRVAATAGEIKRYAISGQDVQLATPKQRTTRVVMYLHALRETPAFVLHDPNKARAIAPLLAAGYAVAVGDGGGRAPWGNPASVAAYRALYGDLGRRGYRSIYLLSESMGGLAGLTLAGELPIKAWAGIFPVCNLRSVYASKGFRQTIDAALPAGSRFVANSPVPVGRVRGLPMLFWASPADTYVPKALNTDPCAQARRAAGAKVTVIRTRGEHADASNYDGARLTRFFDQASG